MLTDFQDSQPFSDAYDISCNNFKEVMDYYCLSNLYINNDEVQRIEHIMRGQTANEHWQSYRLYRVTASNFYSAIVNSVEPSFKLKSMYYSSFYFVIRDHGKLYESHVLTIQSEDDSRRL